MKITVAGFNCDVTADEAPDAVQTFEGTKKEIEPSFIKFCEEFKWTTVISMEGMDEVA
jgi:hypothetical protein